MKEKQKALQKNIYRAKSLVAVHIVRFVGLWLFASFWLIVCFFTDAPPSAIIITFLLAIPASIFCIYWIIKLPYMVGEFKDGKLYLYPSRRRCVKLNPQDIKNVTVKFYYFNRNPHMSGVHGKLTVDTNTIYGQVIIHYVGSVGILADKIESFRDRKTKVQYEEEINEDVNS